MLTEKSGGADNPVTSRKVLLSCPFSQYRTSGSSPARPKPVDIPTVPLSVSPGHQEGSFPVSSSNSASEQYLLEEKACGQQQRSSMSVSMTDFDEDFLQSEKGS